MKAELNINTQELAQEITQTIIKALKPFLKNQAADETVFDVPALASYLKVSSKWIYERTHLSEIPHYKVIGKLMFKKSEIDNWLAGYKIPAVSNSTTFLKIVKK